MARGPCRTCCIHLCWTKSAWHRRPNGSSKVSRSARIKVNFDVEGEKRRLGQATELTLFRVLQESLTNIHRHAKASAAEVILKY